MIASLGQDEPSALLLYHNKQKHHPAAAEGRNPPPRYNYKRFNNKLRQNAANFPHNQSSEDRPMAAYIDNKPSGFTLKPAGDY